MSKKKNLNALLAISVFLLAMASTTARATIYVDATKNGDGSNWPNAYKYLQDALTDAQASPDDIWVADGTYKPTTGSDRTASFQLINGVGVYGGFTGGETTLNERDWQTNVTILSGDLNGDDVGFTNNGENSYHVVKAIGVGGTAVLDGFTIIGGNANGSWPNNAGGGMYNGGGSPTVTNCTFSGNSADYGGGMGNRDYSSPTVTNCMFSSNQAVYGSGMYNYWSDPTVTNCTFSGNSAVDDGGGMYNNNAVTTVTNCTFSGNSATNNGGGMYNLDSILTVVNCAFSGNTAVDDGGGMYNNSSSSPMVTNCTFSGNSAVDKGGGMYNVASSPTLTNCTFSGNSANFGGGMCNMSGSQVVTNCILWGNSGLQIHDFESSPTVTYSDVEGGYTGTGNIGSNPLFVDADGPDNVYGTADDNLRLSVGSPCIDAADNTVVPADTADLDNDANTTERTPLDLDGKLRFFDDVGTADTGAADPPDYLFVVDMGAYECGVVIYVDGGAGGANKGTSWADAYKYLADALTDADARTEPVQIQVAEGSYKPDETTANPTGTDLRTDTFALINGVSVCGGFPSGGGKWGSRDPNAYETILSGDLNGDDGPDFANNGENSYHVVTGSGTNANAVLDGFTITAGNANGSVPSERGAGMYNNSGSPTVTNCTFSGNRAVGNGGGGMYNEDGSPMVTNCTFSGNAADLGRGGVMYNYISSPTVVNCAFSGNTAGEYGGGIHNYESDPNITNCTFSGNSAGGWGGGMFNLSSSDPNITNCILWGNTDSGLTDESAQICNAASTPVVSYSCVQGWTGGLGGTGNIGDDPLFKDPNGPDDIAGTEDDDLSLSFDSPCIDAGDNNSVPADTADLDGDGDTGERTPLDLAGNARFTDDPYVVNTGNHATFYPEIVEMGAYERYEFCDDAGHPFPIGDISGPIGKRDCRVDFFDFAVVAAHWLEDTQPE